MSDGMLEKIAKLLAQAEGTNNAEEAAAFTEKAQKLAAMYSIDLAMAQYKAAHKDAREELTTRRIAVGEPGRQHKNRFWSDLAIEICTANDVRCTIAGDNSAIWAYGFPSDIDLVEKLFASLNVQMVDGANRALAAGEHKRLGVHGRSFRPNFYSGFVREMGSRLMRAKYQAVAEQRERDEAAAALAARDEVKPTDVQDEPVTAALVLAKKTEKVDEFFKKNNNATRSYRSYGATSHNHGAQNLGRQHAASANIGGSAGQLAGGRKQLG